MFFKCFFQPNWCKTKTCSTQKWAIPHCVPISKCSDLCGIHQNGRPITAWALSSSFPKSFPMLNSSACLSVHCHVALKLRQDARFYARKMFNLHRSKCGYSSTPNKYIHIYQIGGAMVYTDEHPFVLCLFLHKNQQSRSRLSP